MKLNWNFLGGGDKERVLNEKPSMGKYGYLLALHNCDHL